MKTLEERVIDMEDLIADMPHLMNLRLETLVAAQAESNSRINVLDKQMTIVIREIRDLRGGVTRQLMEQDKRIASLQADMNDVKSDISTLKSDVSTMKSDVAKILARLPG